MAEANEWWNEIQRLHREIEARLDESDRRAAARGKERAEQRAALDGQSNVSAEQSFLPEAAKIDLKKWTETWDRFFQLLESKFRDVDRMKAMAEPEWKGRVDRLDEVTIAQARIMERLEQKYGEAIQRHDDAVKKHDEEIAELRNAILKVTSAVERSNTGVEALRSIVEAHEDGIAELRATQVTLMKTFDQFIRGQEGNGRKQ